jgi:hypothetical protein
VIAGSGVKAGSSTTLAAAKPRVWGSGGQATVHRGLNSYQQRCRDSLRVVRV